MAVQVVLGACRQRESKGQIARDGCGRRVPFRSASPWRSRFSLQGRGKAEGSFDYFHKSPLLAEDQALALRHGEVRARVWIGLQACPVTFVRKKISHQVSAASRNDAAPVLGILLEGVPLKGIDLVADKASDLHQCSPNRGFGRYSVTAHGQGRCYSCNNPHEFAAIYLQR